MYLHLSLFAARANPLYFCAVSDRVRFGGEQRRHGVLRLLNHRGLSGVSSGGFSLSELL